MPIAWLVKAQLHTVFFRYSFRTTSNRRLASAPESYLKKKKTIELVYGMKCVVKPAFDWRIIEAFVLGKVKKNYCKQEIKL